MTTCETCPACLLRADLTTHRDTTAAEWSPRRAAYSFAIVLAERACPEYQPNRVEEPAP